MKNKNEIIFLRQILKCRKSGVTGNEQRAYNRAKGSGTARAVNAIAAILARNLRLIIFDDGLRLSLRISSTE
jgi:hypothetical protein